MLDKNESLLFLLLIGENPLLFDNQLSLFFENNDELLSSEGGELFLYLWRIQLFIEDELLQSPSDSFEDLPTRFLYDLLMEFDLMKIYFPSSSCSSRGEHSLGLEFLRKGIIC